MALQINSQQPALPLVNGVGYSHQSLSLLVDGVPWEAGLVSINYATALNPQPLKATSPRPAGYTLGMLEESGDFELYTQWGKAFVASLGDGYGVKVHKFVVQKNEGGDVQTDTILARIKKVDQQSSGDNPLTMKFELVVTKVLINGLDIVPNRAQGQASTAAVV